MVSRNQSEPPLKGTADCITCSARALEAVQDALRYTEKIKMNLKYLTSMLNDQLS